MHTDEGGLRVCLGRAWELTLCEAGEQRYHASGRAVAENALTVEELEAHCVQRIPGGLGQSLEPGDARQRVVAQQHDVHWLACALCGRLERHRRGRPSGRQSLGHVLEPVDDLHEERIRLGPELTAAAAATFTQRLEGGTHHLDHVARDQLTVAESRVRRVDELEVVLARHVAILAVDVEALGLLCRQVPPVRHELAPLAPHATPTRHTPVDVVVLAVDAEHRILAERGLLGRLFGKHPLINVSHHAPLVHVGRVAKAVRGE